jgi:transposase
MSKSYDLRVQAVSYVRAGGSKADAARLFGVTRRTIYNWLEMGEDVRQKARPGPKRNRKVPAEALKEAVAAQSDARLIELAHQFGVHPSTISKALKRLGYSRKKNVALRRGKTL